MKEYYNQITFDILIINFTTKVFRPDITSPTICSLQKTEFSQDFNCTFKNSIKCFNSDQEGSFTPQYLLEQN